MPHVKIVEVGPRDGIQNIPQPVSTKVKIELINKLADSGLSIIEPTSFVSPKWVPQLADAKQVLQGISSLMQSQIGFPVLVPNLHGLELAYENRVKEGAVFVSASEGFSKRNINCSVDESLERVREVTEKAVTLGIKIRGYVSCIFADPYDGPTNPSQVVKVTKYLLDHGCYEVSLGDTLGIGTVADVKRLLEELLKTIPASKLAGHFHDTYGQAISNVLQSYQMGIRTFDSSIAGLGGCPFAVGATGNLSTEDLVYTLHSMGVSTGVDLSKLVSTGTWISQVLGIPNGSRAGAALATKYSSLDVSRTLPNKLRRNWKVIGSANEYQVHRSGPNIKVCLTRPKNGNSLTKSMAKGLTTLFRKLAQDTSVFRIVLTGEGKFFCTGMDLSKDAGTPDERFLNLKHLFDAIDNCPQTTIAAVNGPCFGGGVGLAFVCDLRIFTSKATVKLSEAQLGLCPAVISKYIIREWGINFARASMLTAREVAPSELAALHVIYAVVEDGNALQGKVEDLLDDLKFSAPHASGLCKDLVRIAWRDAGGERQEKTIRASFDAMMAEGSESTHALALFQQGRRRIDWDVFTRSKSSKL
ncbi:hypothetical protein BGZ60DRAFT_533515 [Tricladium varicosporioides]|nr:hypothetical protein BGZ60DRAFT_533515 [Hymenoscyphus varicosporioides]